MNIDKIFISKLETWHYKPSIRVNILNVFPLNWYYPHQPYPHQDQPFKTGIYIYKPFIRLPLSPPFDKHISPSGGRSRNWPILSCGQNDALPQNADSHTCIINHWPVRPRRAAWRKRTPRVASQIFERVIFFMLIRFE